MKKLDSKLVREISSYMNGARREKFLASVQILNDSLAQGGWTPRGSVKASSGFYQGLSKKFPRYASFELSHCISYGHAPNAEVTDELVKSLVKGNVESVLAWVHLCREVQEARKLLDAARPMPKITAIGLSPKVTKTFQECNLDLDVQSIRMAEIAFYEVPDYHKDGTPMMTRDGKPVMKRIYYVKWSEGIKHGQSRFSSGGCEACGKTIPSGRFVPVEASCKKLGRISLWLGCDCAKNIFGIQDLGIDKNAKAPE